VGKIQCGNSFRRMLTLFELFGAVFSFDVETLFPYLFFSTTPLPAPMPMVTYGALLFYFVIFICHFLKDGPQNIARRKQCLEGRPITSLGHQAGAKSFLRGPKFFKHCPVVLSNVQHISPGRRKFFCVSHRTGLRGRNEGNCPGPPLQGGLLQLTASP